jgi:signal transduction histidine kinase
LLSLPYMPVGLVEVRQGPVDELTLLHLGRIDSASRSVRVSKIISSTLGLMALLLWLVRPKTVLLLFASMCGCIAVRDALYGASRLPFPAPIFEQLNPFLILCFAVVAQAATLQLFSKLTARRQRWLLILWAIFSALFVAAELAQTGAMWLRAMVMVLGNLTLLFIVCQIWVWRRKLESGRAGVLVVGYAVLLLCSLHDLGMVTGMVPATRGTQIPWGFAALVLCYAVITADHVLRQLALAENAQHVLLERVAQTRRELEHSYRQLAQHEKQSAVRQERSQILRELHDSLGSQLITAMRGVERDALSKEELLRSLQDGLADLRQLLSTHRTEGRLTEALANWRLHWEDRLSSAGVNTRWMIAESVDPVILSPEHLHHVMRILQESATNTLKHAKASLLSIEAAADSNRVVLKFSDNGCGMGPADPAAASGSSGQGLIGMRARAAQMGGDLSVGSGPDGMGTCVTLVLPPHGGQDQAGPVAGDGSAHQPEP